jgi:hypothetical protein
LSRYKAEEFLQLFETSNDNLPIVRIRPPFWYIHDPDITGAISLGLLVFIVVYGQPPTLETPVELAQVLLITVVYFGTGRYCEFECLWREISQLDRVIHILDKINGKTLNGQLRPREKREML